MALHKGACYCGAVSFEVDAALHPPDACHCSQCRKQSGHFWSSTDVSRADLVIHGAESLSWFRSSEKARRGFCSICGSFLFWDLLEKDVVAIAMGAFDSPTDTQIEMHIFVADKGDYYAIEDGLPQHQ